MAPPPLKDDRTHFCSCLYCSRVARSPRYKWCHGNDYSCTGLGRDRNINSHSISSQSCCSWDPTNTTRNGTKHLDTSEVHPAHTDTPPIQTHLLATGKWQGTRHFSWYKRDPLLPQKCQEAFCCWWCGHKTGPLVLLVTYFFATRIPVLLPSSPQQCYRLTPKHAELQGANHDPSCLK